MLQPLQSLNSLLNTCIRRLKLRTLPTLTSPLQHQLASYDEHGLLNKRLNYLPLLLLHFLPLYRKPYQQLMTSSVLRLIMGGWNSTSTISLQTALLHMLLLLSSILRIPRVILRASGGLNQHGYLAQRQGFRSSRKTTQMDHFQLDLNT
jgi:hypothetical protein